MSATPTLGKSEVPHRRGVWGEMFDGLEILYSAFEDAPDAMLLIGSTGQILKANARTAVMFGYDLDEINGQAVEILIPQRFVERHAVLRTEYLVAPRLRPMGEGRNLFGRRKDDTEFPVDIMLSPLKLDAKDLILAVVRDATARSKLEAKVQAAHDMYLKEVHHRVKNNLQVISSLLFLQSTHLSDPGVLAAFRESQDRVNAIALIHEKLYSSPDLVRLDVRSYVTDLVSDLVRSYGFRSEDLAVEVVIDDVSMNVDTAIPCGLIINELISNVFKHAFKPGETGSLRVELKAAGPRQFVLTVSDDGIGLPKGFNSRESKSLGLKLVNDLAKQLDGTVEVTTNRGTSFKISFSERKRQE